MPPLWIATLLGALLQLAGSLVGRILISLGFGYAAFKGVDVLFTWIGQGIRSNLSGLPVGIAGMIGALKIDVAVNILLSSIPMRLTLSGLQGGTFKKLVMK